MTAEERMAYFQGEKRRNSQTLTVSKEKNRNLIFFKFKFFIAMILFIAFLSLDYTGYQIHGIGSSEIIEQVTKDLELPEMIRSLKNYKK